MWPASRLHRSQWHRVVPSRRLVPNEIHATTARNPVAGAPPASAARTDRAVDSAAARGRAGQAAAMRAQRAAEGRAWAARPAEVSEAEVRRRETVLAAAASDGAVRVAVAQVEAAARVEAEAQVEAAPRVEVAAPLEAAAAVAPGVRAGDSLPGAGRSIARSAAIR